MAEAPNADDEADDEAEAREPVAAPDPKKRFLLTASFADQEALMAPPPEPIPTAPRPLPSAPRLAPIASRKGPGGVALGVHRFVSEPMQHPSWSDFVARVLELGLPAWQGQVLFRLVMLALHGRDPETRLSSLGRLCAELDPWLTPEATLMLGPVRYDAPAASPIAAPKLAGIELLAGLEFPTAPPDAVASLFAAMCGWAAWHAPAVQVYGALEDPPAPLDLVLAMAQALSRPTQHVPLPAMPGPEPMPIERMLGHGVMIRELQAARQLVREAPAEAARRLPTLIRRAPIPAARIALMQGYAHALRQLHGLPAPGPDAPGLLAQIEARFASPLASVYATAHVELLALTRIDDPIALGLDLPLRHPGALATAIQAIAQRRTVPRWVVANTQGGDRSRLCATLLGRLPSADVNLLDALLGLAPPELEAALHETLRESWTPSAAKIAARATLQRLGRTP